MREQFIGGATIAAIIAVAGCARASAPTRMPCSSTWRSTGWRRRPTWLLVGSRGVKRTYRKLHLFNEEKRWFDPGNLPLSVDRVGGCRVGMMVCYDWVVPEGGRTRALRGAQEIAHPANLVLPLAQRAMITRCIENGVFSITANRTGAD